MSIEKRLEWDVGTRKFLGGPDGVGTIQKTLCSLSPEVLDDLLYDWAEDTSWSKRNVVRLSVDGSLFRFVQEESERLKPIFEQYNRKFGPLLPSGLLPPRDSGGIHVVSRDECQSVAFHYDQFGFVRRSNAFPNSLTIYRYGEGVPEHSEDLCLLATRVCERILTNDFFEWGYCCIGDEYDANNIDYSNGACAVGRDFSKMLPGFFWGNYFGAFLIEKIGESKLVAVPGCSVERLGHGVLVTNKLPPDEWQLPDYQQNRIAAMEHLGRHFFFEKGKDLKGTLFPVEPIPGVAADESPDTIQVWMK